MSFDKRFSCAFIFAIITVLLCPIPKLSGLDSSSLCRTSKDSFEGERLADYLLGSWVVDNDVNYMETTYLKDGTFKGKFKALKGDFAPGEGVKFEYSGEWRIEGAVCLMTTTIYDSEPVKSPRTNRYRIASIKQKSHKAIDTANGSVGVYLRKIKRVRGDIVF